MVEKKRLNIRLSLEELRIILGDRVVWKGSTEQSLKGVASLDQALSGDIAFLANPKYASQVEDCEASLILVPEDFDGEPADDQAFALMKHPSLGLAWICGAIERQLSPPPEPGIDGLASVSPDASVSDTACVGPFCVIEAGAEIGPGVHLKSHVTVGRGVKIGADSVIFPHVSVYAYCEIGARCRVHAGSVIGSDGFGYATVEGVHHKEPQIGIVQLEDDVEIGANTTIDRARFDVTRIGQGAKIDNLVQIAHNVQIGPGSVLVSQVGISGSTELGTYVVVGGQAGLAGHLKVGDGAMIGAQAGVNRDIEAGAKVRGTPHLEMTQFARIAVLQKRLPEFFKRLTALEQASE
ncbi:MAG: UDP-3-O-(3-hydroxymyristoyl)glucosamine N-acyltransferase [Verrucomicrobiota bacterium]